MPLTSINAVFDGKDIKPLEPVPVVSPYLVVVTFLEPTHENFLAEQKERQFWDSFGAWRDSRTTPEILHEIHTSISKTEPPSL